MHRELLSSLLILAAATPAVGAWKASGTAPPPPASPTDARSDARRSLPFFYDLYTFRGHEGGTSVVASFAVPVERLNREREDHEVLYRFDVTLVLADVSTRSVARTDDSVFVSVPRPLDGSHLLYTHVEIETEPSATTVQRVILTDASKPGRGQLYTSPFPIPDYGGSHLMLSDLAMGQPDAGAGWRRGEVTLALLPTDHFDRSSFELYYEIYNLPAGNRYDTEIVIEPVDEAGRRIAAEDPVRFSFSDVSGAAEGASQNELRHLDGSLERGHYRLTVIVRDEGSGQSARRSRLFHVTSTGEGATLVRALPARWGGGAR